MILTIYDIDPLKNFFDVINDTTDVVELRLDNDGLEISLLNKSHVAFYNLVLKKDFFEDYMIDGAESVLIFVNDFYKILKSSKNGEVLSLQTDDSHLVCKFEKDGNRRIFELPLAEEYGDSPAPPSIDYDCTFQISLSDLKQPCADLVDIVGTDMFKMITKDNSLFIVSPNDTMTNYSHEIMIDSDKSVQSIVDIKYLKDLPKLSKIDESITMKIGNNIPLTWNITSVDECISIGGLIAPVIEEE